ncbi:MAG: ferrous iron transport protein A [Endomicrobiales bacterium]|nr:ferrous iron transport protein A [Endomicrobiales bacterium]
MIVDLTQLKKDEVANIVEIRGGRGFQLKMENLGIRIGKKIQKISSQFLGGPQTIKIDNMRFAIGCGMARRIFLEVKR